MVVVKGSLLEVTVDNEPNRVVRQGRGRKLVHRRNTQTNLLSCDENLEKLWAISGKVCLKSKTVVLLWHTLESDLRQIRLLIETQTCRPQQREDDGRVGLASPENNEVYFLRACEINGHNRETTKAPIGAFVDFINLSVNLF